MGSPFQTTLSTTFVILTIFCDSHAVTEFDKFGNSTGLTLVYVSGARLLDWGSSFPHKDGFNRACYFFKTFLTLFSSSAANVFLVIKKNI